MTGRFGPLLKQLRRRAGMTQERLAERSGVSVRTIRGFETGQRDNPRAGTARLLADSLGLTSSERAGLLMAAVGPAEATGGSAAVPDRVAPPDDRLATAVDDLAHAVGARWRREEEQRRIQDPFPLPVRWEPVAEKLTDHWANICRAPAGDTSDPLDLAGELDRIVDVYRRIPSGRLVVLGRAGSGKTVLALRLVLDLLKPGTRAHTDPVPVIFSLSSWHPDTSSLRDWLIGRLVRDHPGLAAPSPGAASLAAALVDANRILPVLDGFDEISGGLRQLALEQLNAITLPLVLTSRHDEYAAAVAGIDVLTAAAVVELTDLALGDASDYLRRATRKAGTDPATGSATGWEPVLAELRQHPDSPASRNLATVLATPLMVMLARTSYSDAPGRDPAALLDAGRFGTVEALEEHLLDTFIPAVYRHRPGTRGRRWEPDLVQHWLGHLARHLKRLDTRDLAWWHLGGTMRRSTRVLVTGLAAGLIVGLVDLLVSGLLAGLTYRSGRQPGLGYLFVDAVLVGLMAGLVFGLVHWLAVGSGDAMVEPARIEMRILCRTSEMRARFVSRLRVGLVGGLVVGFGYGLLIALANRPAPGGTRTGTGLVDELVTVLVAGLVNGLVFALVVGLGAGLVGGLIAGFEAPLDIRSAVNPLGLLTANRRTVVFQLLIWVPVFGCATGLGPFLVIGLLQGFTGHLVWGPMFGLTFGLVGGIGGGLGYGLNLSAWGRWVIFCRVWLPLTGRLPWAVVTFLDDAYQRGVLRQTGAVYQFRHARLQDRLSQPPGSCRRRGTG